MEQGPYLLAVLPDWLIFHTIDLIKMCNYGETPLTIHGFAAVHKR